MAFTAIMVLINNSCGVAIRATVNGLGQTSASLGRMCGPAVSGVVFAWSQRNGLSWPLNFHLMFDVIALLAICNALLTRSLSPSLDRKKQEPGLPSPSTNPPPTDSAPGPDGNSRGAASRSSTKEESTLDDDEGDDDRRALLATNLREQRKEEKRGSPDSFHNEDLDDEPWLSIEENSPPADQPRVVQSRML